MVIDWDLDPVDASVTVPVGSVVEWQWDESEPLTVTSGERGSTLAGLLFRSARALSGSYRVRFLEPGLYSYHDEEHFWNEAVIFVVGGSDGGRRPRACASCIPPLLPGLTLNCVRLTEEDVSTVPATTSPFLFSTTTTTSTSMPTSTSTTTTSEEATTATPFAGTVVLENIGSRTELSAFLCCSFPCCARPASCFVSNSFWAAF